MNEFRQIGDILDVVFGYAKAEDWAGLDEYVRTFNYAYEPAVNAVSVLRSSFSLRTKLVYWQDAVNRARAIHGDKPFTGLF